MNEQIDKPIHVELRKGNQPEVSGEVEAGAVALPQMRTEAEINADKAAEAEVTTGLQIELQKLPDHAESPLKTVIPEATFTQLTNPAQWIKKEPGSDMLDAGDLEAVVCQLTIRTGTENGNVVKLARPTIHQILPPGQFGNAA